MDPRAQLADWAKLRRKDTKLFLKEIQRDIIASPTIADPLFGKRKSIYTDFFASSKPLNKFETIMTQKVLPFYANTHTSTTSTSKSTSMSVRLARETIARCTNAIITSSHEHQAAVIFSGDGSTSAINKIRNVFRLGDEAYWLRKVLAESSKSHLDVPGATTSTSADFTSTSATSAEFHNPSTTSTSCYIEHHSNLLPWRESCADVVVIPENGSHQLDLDALEQQLILHQHRPLKLGTFSAGSNLTGVLNDTVAISELLHKYGAYAFYDFAGVGPYTTIDMNPPPSPSTSSSEKNLAYKDGVFISTHKFLGGPGASGVLVARLEIFGWVEEHRGAKDRNEYFPTTPGGGTVDMVIQGRHKYANSVLAREEAGTPNILATIRTGLVFQLQEIVGPDWILQKEYKLAKGILARLTTPKMKQAVHVLGASDQYRVAVFSLTIAVPRFRSRDGERFRQIHYALLSTIMNDFFGIEMRGGCMCAGPYASQLLKFDKEKDAAFWRLLLGETSKPAKEEAPTNTPLSPTNIHKRDLCFRSLKPGFVRFSFSYFARDKDVEFVLQSLEWVAQYGYLLIPLYRLNAASGEWSIREAVCRAVLNEIPPRRKFCASRDYCIPVAVDCIYGLRKLFQEHVKPTLLCASPALGSPYLSPESRSVDSGHSSHGSRISESACRMARQSLNDIFGHALHRPNHGSIPSPPDSENISDNEDSPSINIHGVHGDPEWHEEPHHHLGNTKSTPFLVSISSLDMSSTPGMNRPTMLDISQRAHSATSTSTEAPSFPTRGSFRGNSASAQTKTWIKTPGIFSATRHITAKNRQILVDALEELAWDKLEAEVEAVEINDLARDLSWFVSPLDVARLYTQELRTPSGQSPFPRRVK